METPQYLENLENPKQEELQTSVYHHIVELHRLWCPRILSFLLSVDSGFPIFFIFPNFSTNSFKSSENVTILKITQVSENFHDRFSAKHRNHFFFKIVIDFFNFSNGIRVMAKEFLEYFLLPSH